MSPNLRGCERSAGSAALTALPLPHFEAPAPPAFRSEQIQPAPSLDIFVMLWNSSHAYGAKLERSLSVVSSRPKIMGRRSAGIFAFMADATPTPFSYRPGTS